MCTAGKLRAKPGRLKEFHAAGVIDAMLAWREADRDTKRLEEDRVWEQLPEAEGAKQGVRARVCHGGRAGQGRKTAGWRHARWRGLTDAEHSLEA